MSSDLEFESEGRRFGGARLVMVTIGLAAAGAAAAYWFLRDEAEPVQPAAQQTARVVQGNLVTTLSLTGTAQASREASLSFRSGSRILSVAVSAGDVVKAGQELGRADPSDAQRALARAEVSVEVARAKLADLLAGPDASAVASANQSVADAQISLADAEQALADALDGPSDDQLAVADKVIAQATKALDTAKRAAQSARDAVLAAERALAKEQASLTNAQRGYCSTFGIVVFYCDPTDLPLTDEQVDDLTRSLARLTVSPSEKNAVTSAANSFVGANDARARALAAVDAASQKVSDADVTVTDAEASLGDATAARADVFLPPSTATLDKLRNNVTKASLALETAKTRLVDANKGAEAVDLAQQRLAVTDAEAAVETAKESLAELVLVAPYDATVADVGVSVGDTTTGPTVAFELVDDGHIVVTMNVSETDVSRLKAGQWGLAAFEALTGSQYIVQVTQVGRTPVTAQGVTTYQVRATVVMQSDLDATERASLQLALPALLGGRIPGTGGGQGGLGAGGQGAAGPGGQSAERTPGTGRPGGAGGTPPANFTPPANITPQAGGRQGAGAGINLGALLGQPLPIAGMSATVTVLQEVVADQVLVPTGAVRASAGASFVVVVKEDGTTEQRMVTTGRRDATNTAVLTGLEVGELVQAGSITVAGAATTAAGQAGALPRGGIAGGGAAGGAAPPGGATIR